MKGFTTALILLLISFAAPGNDKLTPPAPILKLIEEHGYNITPHSAQGIVKLPTGEYVIGLCSLSEDGWLKSTLVATDGKALDILIDTKGGGCGMDVESSDINNDGLVDLIIYLVYEDGNYLYVLLNTGDVSRYHYVKIFQGGTLIRPRFIDFSLSNGVKRMVLTKIHELYGMGFTELLTPKLYEFDGEKYVLKESASPK